MGIRVLLVDDHRLVRRGVRRLLEARGFEVVGEASDGREAVELTGSLAPDVVLMDLAMPEMNGIEATRRIVAERPEIAILALSGVAEEARLTEMLSAGARGYVLKDADADELAQAIERVAAGSAFLSCSATELVLTDYRRRDVEGPAAVLSGREREVLQLLAEGSSTKETASRLGVSPKTVESHRAHIMSKLGLYTVAELTKYAVRTGLTALGR